MAHIHEAIDLVCDALIVHQGRVLFIHHRKAGRWLAPGGHVELDEDLEQALFREVEEETGLTRADLELLDEVPPDVEPRFACKPLPRPRWSDIHRVSERDQHRHMRLAYLLRAKTDMVKLADEEHHAIRWFYPEELRDPALNVPPTVIRYAEEAVRIVS